MVEVTKGKNVTIETYDAESKEFVGDGTAVAFIMTGAIAESDVKYSRAYVDNAEVSIASITTATKTVTLVISEGVELEIREFCNSIGGGKCKK